jgi:hypothetical protein
MKTPRTQFLVPTVRSARSVAMAAFGLILALGAAAVGAAHPAAAVFSATTAPSSGSTLRIAADTCGRPDRTAGRPASKSPTRRIRWGCPQEPSRR